MIPTVEQARTRIRALLDDDAGNTFTDGICQEGIAEAFDIMYSAMLASQVGRVKIITTYTLPALTTSLTPLTVGIAGFGELVRIEERQGGSSGEYVDVHEVDTLRQRDPGTSLREFTWREDTWHFIGATEVRQLQVTYFSTGTAPTTGSLGVDGCLGFISKYGAAAIGPRKGYDEIAPKYRVEAVGPRYDEGIIGGDLFRLIQPMERSLQRTPIAPQPYSTQRWRRPVAVPYIEAPLAASGGSMPTIFSSAAGTITGTIDGTNAQFFLSVPVTSVAVYVNGVAMTPSVDFAHITNVVTFLSGSIPWSGSLILVHGWS